MVHDKANKYADHPSSCFSHSFDVRLEICYWYLRDFRWFSSFRSQLNASSNHPLIYLLQKMPYLEDDYAVAIQPRQNRSYAYNEQHSHEEQYENRSVAPIIERERQMRRYMSNILRNQTDQIRIVSKKHQILKVIAIVLSVMVAISWLSSGECEAPEQTPDLIQKVCMQQHTELNCSSNDKRSMKNAKTCQDLEFCLKDPVNYQIKKDQQKWKEYLNNLEEIAEYAMGHSWWACLFLVICTLGNYLIQR